MKSRKLLTAISSLLPGVSTCTSRVMGTDLDRRVYIYRLLLFRTVISQTVFQGNLHVFRAFGFVVKVLKPIYTLFGVIIDP